MNSLRLVPLFLTIAALLAAVSSVQAQNIIKQPGAHPNYTFDAEPHLLVRDRTGHAGAGIGPGFRGTVVVADRGFISKLNDSVGIGFGLDWVVFGDDHCHGGRQNFDHCHDHSQVVLPLVMQWNFWLHPKWSVFGEPGLALIFNDDEHDYDDDFDIDPFVFYAGGRFLFSDSVALTMRLGFPFTASVGVSFLL